MNLKKKLIGFGAATLLSLSVVSGAIAQEGHSFTDSRVNVDLLPNVCSVSASTSDVTFGPWEFDGTGNYVLTGTASQAIRWDMTIPGPGQTCDVSFSMFGSSLSSGDHSISSENLSFSVYNYGGVGDLGGKRTVALSPQLNHYGGAFFLDIPNDAEPGAYTGTIRIETTNAD